MVVRFIKVLVFVLFPVFYFSQYEENLTFGLKIGAVNSRISNIPEMLLGREHYLTNFEMKTRGVYGVEGGAFLNYKFPDTRTAIQPEITYRTGGEELTYTNEVLGRNYQLDFKYSYLVLGAVYKLYPYKGLNLGVGIHYAKNLQPHNIEYTSNEFDGRYDTNYRQFYRDGIEGKDDFQLSFNLGYELAHSFHFDLRYYLGLGDAVGTRSTSFQFIENTNRNTLLTLSVGYSFHNW